MKIEVVHDIPADPQDVLEWVSDLEKYPVWTNALHRVIGEATAPDADAAWLVELRGKIGPFARSKRLRMVRLPTSSPFHVQFERRELDGLEHGSWRFDVRVAPVDDSRHTRVIAVFEYEGRLWSSAVERILRDEIEMSKSRLTAAVLEGCQPTDQAL